MTGSVLMAGVGGRGVSNVVIMPALLLAEAMRLHPLSAQGLAADI